MSVMSEASYDRAATGSVSREAMLLRRAGELAQAVAVLNGRDPDDWEAGLLHFKLLFELQRFGELQDAVREAVIRAAAIGPEAGSEYLVFLVRFAQRVCLVNRRLEKFVEDIEGAVRSHRDALQAWRALGARLRFRQHVAAHYTGQASINSIGLNCLPWHLPALWGFRNATGFRDQFHSFSLAGHRLEGVIDAIETDFASYCVPETIRVVETANGHKLPMRKDRGAMWNHNRSDYWTADECAALRLDAVRKAEKFRKACREPDAVFLLSRVEHEFPGEKLDFLPALNAALERHTGSPRNRILISNQTAEGRVAKLYKVDDHTAFFYCPYPRADYVWHDDALEESREGLTYERQYAGLMLAGLVHLGLYAKRDGDGDTGSRP